MDTISTIDTMNVTMDVHCAHWTQFTPKTQYTFIGHNGTYIFIGLNDLFAWLMSIVYNGC